jgi:hypothetical protein
MSKHGNQMSKRFEVEEKARRERLGKLTVAPQPPVQSLEQSQEPTVPRFDVSNGERE